MCQIYYVDFKDMFIALNLSFTDIHTFLSLYITKEALI